MATVTLTQHSVNPTEGDVHGGLIGRGKRGLEVDIVAGLSRMAKGVISGFDTLGGTGLNRSINAGVAVIDGYTVTGTVSTPVIALTANRGAGNPNRLWLQLVKNAGKVVGVQLVTSDANLVDAILLRHIQTGASDVTAQTDKRVQGRVLWGVFNTDGTIVNHGSGDWTAATVGTGQGKIVPDVAFFSVPTPIGVVGQSTAPGAVQALRCSAATVSDIRFTYASENIDVAFWIFG